MHASNRQKTCTQPPEDMYPTARRRAPSGSKTRTQPQQGMYPTVTELYPIATSLGNVRDARPRGGTPPPQKKHHNYYMYLGVGTRGKALLLRLGGDTPPRQYYYYGGVTGGQHDYYSTDVLLPSYYAGRWHYYCRVPGGYGSTVRWGTPPPTVRTTQG